MKISFRHHYYPIHKITMFRSFPLAATVALILSSSFILVHCTRSNNTIINGGFSVNLIHRDSPKSPLHDMTILTDPFQHVNNAIQRSQQRYKQLASTKLIPAGGEYLMKISYGTPPFESFAIVDTGSFLVWIQCLPCINCFHEKYPPFNPTSSSTFRFASTGQCPLMVSRGTIKNTTSTNAPCHYRIGYGDGSYTSGDFAYDTVTFGQGAFPNFLFGCGHDNVGFSPMQSGLVGLGPQSLSLVSQLSSTMTKKFSYCLVPLVEPSKSGVLSFGDQAVITGPGVVKTPLVINTYYSLIIQSISVGGVAKVKFLDNNGTKSRSRKLQGGENLIIIDSGSTLTYLPTYVYNKLEEIVRSQIRSTAIPDPSRYFGLCYPPSLRDEDIPIITFHFKDAAVNLKPVNTFIRNTPLARCLAFTKSDSVSVFGNIAHSNFLVGYDLENRSVSFKPVDCAILSK